jgi:hypothetical protein
MCFIEKSVIEFNVTNQKYGDGRSSYCKPCQSAYYKAYNQARKAAHAKYDVQYKKCRSCALEKPISQFGKKSTSLDKHNIYCNPCWRRMVLIASRKMNNAKKTQS